MEEKQHSTQATTPDQPRPAWHARSTEQVMQKLGCDSSGLDSPAASERLERFGPNTLEQAKRSSALVRFFRHFHNILIYILILAAVGTALLGHWVDTGVILAVVLINTLIGFIQEGRAEKALDAIRAMLSPKATVLRDGQRQQIPASDVVPGDVLYLQAGDKVAADVRLIESKNLQIEEAVLTGESMPVDKDTEPVSEEAALGDRRGMAYSGTLVTYGRGMGLVIATGSDTEIGRISSMLSDVESLKTPLVRQMEQFGRTLALVIVAIAAVTFVFGLAVRDYPLSEMFLAAASLAVAAIPEGLPAIVTIALAIGVQKMAGRNAIIRRLPAVETLGSVSCICSDKTGTLTRNEMTAQALAMTHRRIDISGVGYTPRGAFHENGSDMEPTDDAELTGILRAGLLCNDASLWQRDGDWVFEGNPTEVALLTLAGKASLDQHSENERSPRQDVIPFDSQHKYMATLHHDHQGQAMVYLKGAPERLLELCSHQQGGSGAEPIDPSLWQQRMDELAGQGQRLLAIARREAPTDSRSLDFADVERGQFTLLALVGIMDPPRDEAIQAVATCRGAGIRVKMITGDHLVTARAIGEQLGITTQGDGEALGGHEIDRMSDAELEEAAARVDVFARTTPEHKLRLVSALQKGRRVVAMTGDGVNDAPALKRSDVGVAMGRKGTEAAKEASEMVLADDNFASISHAVEEGRIVYDNIRKAILHMLPTSAGQALTIMMAILMGLALPLTPVQVLWVNMVTSVTLSLALAFESGEPDIMRRQPRDPAERLLSGFLLWRILFVALLLWIGTFGHFVWMQAAGASDELARTVAINTLAAGQAFYLLNLRLIHGAVLRGWQIFRSRILWGAIGIMSVLQLGFTYLPFMNRIFGTAPVPTEHWGRILAFGLAVFLIVELEKMLFRRFADNAGTKTE